MSGQPLVVVRVNHLERLEKAVIGWGRKVPGDFRREKVEVRVGVGESLHGLEIQMENDWVMWCM